MTLSEKPMHSETIRLVGSADSVLDLREAEVVAREFEQAAAEIRAELRKINEV